MPDIYPLLVAPRGRVVVQVEFSVELSIDDRQ